MNSKSYLYRKRGLKTVVLKIYIIQIQIKLIFGMANSINTRLRAIKKTIV